MPKPANASPPKRRPAPPRDFELKVRAAVGRAFKRARETHGLSQAQMAAALGTSRRWISAIERGIAVERDYDLPSSRLLLNLFLATGCDAWAEALAEVRRKPKP